ncbi:MAG: cytochrome-c peroxidase [Pedobacter sp.]|nr:MAG: cytochrome-c peroxidase [Pedobacter sp.]
MTGPIANKRYIHLLTLVLIITSSCKKEEVIITDDKPGAVRLEVPANFPKYVDDLDNPLTKEGIELGRLLFFDTRLSGNNKLSCGSCHKQDIAFSDAVALTNIGASGQTLIRHSPALINLAWATNGLFWDGGVTNLESQAFAPLTSADEMNQNLTELEYELKQVPDYVKKFKFVFNGEIKSANVVKALSQFQRTLISGNSKYDKYIRKEEGASLNTLELAGLNIINSKCKSCHAGELFTDNSYHNNGLDGIFNDNHEGIYQGRYRITHNLLDMGKFKTPTLRNVMLTAPYMHDGRLKTIEEVLAHYNSNLKNSDTIDRLLFQKNNQLGIPISTNEKEAIMAFLNTLTDNDFISNKKFSNPN